MNKPIVFLAALLISLSAFSQNSEKIDKLIDEGVSLHDKGQYSDALKKYDEALVLDPSNKIAFAEKSMTQLAMARYEDVILTCQLAIQKLPGQSGSSNFYVNYGTALDELKQSEKAISIYNQGLKIFPTSYSLYFNKAITLLRTENKPDAILCLQQTLRNNPEHLKSHRLLGLLLIESEQRIPSIFANSRFLILEPEGERAATTLTMLQNVMTSNVKKGPGNKITLNIGRNMLSDTTNAAATNENVFTATDLNLTMSAALDYDSKNKKKTEVENFIRKFNTICETLKETQAKNHGFYWEYYAPYFIEMSNKGFIDTFAYLAFASTNKKNVTSWIKTHASEIDDFYKWSKTYYWKN